MYGLESITSEKNKIHSQLNSNNYTAGGPTINFKFIFLYIHIENH